MFQEGHKKNVVRLAIMSDKYCGRSIGVTVKVGEQEGNFSSENLKIRNLKTLALSLQLDLQHCPLVSKYNLEHL